MLTAVRGHFTKIHITVTMHTAYTWFRFRFRTVKNYGNFI